MTRPLVALAAFGYILAAVWALAAYRDRRYRPVWVEPYDGEALGI